MKPDKFIWGVGTSAYQIEGGAEADGKGPSIWDVFCREKGRIFQDQNAEVACDSYRLWREDVALVKRLGVSAYRFSVAWPRVFPDGTGRPDPAGLEHYRSLVRLLRAEGIEPFVTLYHWDLPEALSKRGGLMNDDFPAWFEEYTAAVAEALGEDVDTYFTFNEPASIIGAGYCLGAFAPGLKLGNEGFPALKNLLLAHGRAARLLKGMGKHVGIICCGDAPYPAEETEENIEAARREMFSNNCLWHLMNVFDPIFLGDFDPSFYEKYGDVARRSLRGGDLAGMVGNTDYCCMNHYNGYPVVCEGDAPVRRSLPEGAPTTAMGWPVDERGVYWMFRFLGERYHRPMMLTENGMSARDTVENGRVRDEERIEYFKKYLGEVERCRREGLDLRGYFAWSLLDNFEWLEGFSQRFGLVYVDYETLERIPKDSFDFYSAYIRARSAKEAT